MAEGTRYIPQTKVDWTSSQAYTQFRLWKKEVERITNGPMSGESDAVKLNTVYIWAGARAETLIEAKQAEDPTIKIETVKQLLEVLGTVLTHTTFFREAREDFYNIKQKVGENTTTFYSKIIELYRLADFPAGSDFLIVDKLIHGCINEDCKRRLMVKKKDVTVKDCLELLRQYESVDVTMKRFNESCQINASYKSSRDPTRESQKNGARRRTAKKGINNYKTPGADNSKQLCMWCAGSRHPRDKCPAKEAKCMFCFKKGHFQKACKLMKSKKNRSQNAIDISEDESSDDYKTSYDIGTINGKNSKPCEALAKVTFHTNKLKATIQGKVDTGAMVSCMPVAMLSKIGLSKKDITPSNARLRGVTGVDMENHGELIIKVSCNNITKDVKIMITELGSELILGLKFCKQFKLVSIADVCIQRKVELTQNVQAVHITDEKDVNYTPLMKKWNKYLPLGKQTGDAFGDLKLIFPETFDGNVGLFKGEAELKVSPDAKPVQLPPRSVPLSILPKLKTELEKMEKEGIIRPCPETTDWVHNLVIASKKDGEIRLCLDPRNLNKHLIRSIHYTASWEDAQHSFSKGQYFSTLDAKSGYWTKKLSKKSQLYTAFNTPFKKYCFLRLPFGLSVSSEIFCEEMDAALDGIPGTFPCADDVKVQGSTELKHDIHLLETVEKASKAGIKFNPIKCHIKKTKIDYFGRVVSSKGVEPCPKKVSAILKLMPPENKQELQSFLGTVNFMATFIPNLSKKSHLMRGLLKKDVHFVWTSDMQLEFESIQSAIANSVKLTHFDPNQPAIIETDASRKGLGAVLIQHDKPVKFLSKSLTKCESEYSNIERELLAVLFACEKLHNYIFGRTVIIQTDHKPLESIFLKPISLAPARLQRMLLRLRMYDLEVKYVGAKSVLLADTLSRLVKPGSDKAIPDLDVHIAQIVRIKPTYLQSLQTETKADIVLSQLMNFINNGWPDHIHDLAENLHPYWCFRDELAILDGIIMKGCRVVVPASLRTETLHRLHDGHQGLTSTLQRARRTVFWPKIQEDIGEVISCCNECQIHAKKKPRPSEKQISVTKPMEVLGIDLMEFKGQHSIVTIDYFSGYITEDKIKSETAETVITTLNNIFRKFGLPGTIISDNGPCFKSGKFQTFCQSLEIQHITSSPHHHQSNGRVERAIQTVKQIFRKCKSDHEVTLALLAYHDTPIYNNLPSPAELFFNRRINTRLGLMYQPTTLDDLQKTKLMDRRSAHISPPSNNSNTFVPNQSIWFTEDGSPDWKSGFIESQDTHPDSYWIINSENNRRIRRNKNDLKNRSSMGVNQTLPNQLNPVPPTTATWHYTLPPNNQDYQPYSEPPVPQAETRDEYMPSPEIIPQLVTSPTTPTPKKGPDLLHPTTKPNSPMKSRYGRPVKQKRDSSFVY